MTAHMHSPYLEDIPLAEALARWQEALAAAGLDQPLPGERAELDQAAGRVTSEAVWARVSSPHYHASAMDGYAVRAEDTRGASETHPIYLPVGRSAFLCGHRRSIAAGTNAVIMIEEVQLRDCGLPNPQSAIGNQQYPKGTMSEIEICPLSLLAARAPDGEDMLLRS